MARRETRRIAARAGAAIAIACVTLAVFAASALAAPPTVSVAHVAYTNRTVTFASAYETGTAAVALLVDSAEVTRTAVSEAEAGSVEQTATMPMIASVQAVAYDKNGHALSTSAALPFNGASYAPTSAAIPLQQNRILASSYGFHLATSARTTEATLILNGRTAWHGPVEVADGKAILPAAAIHYGRSTAKIVAVNAWGSKTSATVTVYQLGHLPAYWRFVLIDKSDFYLYYINGRRVVSRYPIAIGTAWAPTPTGTFRLWYPQPSPSAVWGVFRMPLQRKVTGGFVRTSYYVHGTNDPSSIGTAASHGCVRMYNSDLRRFATQLKAYSVRPYAVIRN
jgi:lipoprotein-anchoring transpeptidase ErfK/SrfK